MRIVSWNVNGLRSVLGKGFEGFLCNSGADVLCLQETKAFPGQISANFPGWHVFWNPAARPGYSGTVTFSRLKPLNVQPGIGQAECDIEGRVLTLEFPDFHVVNVYAPNAGSELGRLGFKIRVWAPAFRQFLESLERSKPVIFCGDMNVAVEEVDLARPKANAGCAGFTDEERTDFRGLLAGGYVDTFREFEKGPGHYTWWSYRGGARARNVGWRIDYCCVSERLRPRLSAARIHAGVAGSDHCPVEVELRAGAIAPRPSRPIASRQRGKLSSSRKAGGRGLP